MASIIEPRTRRVSEAGRTVLSRWAFCRVDDTLVLCTQGDREPPDEEVELYLKRLDTADFSAILLHSRGGHPTPKQRSRIADYWNTCGRPVPRIAVLTDAVVARAVLKAMEWVMRTLTTKVFAGDAVDAALQWLHAEAPAPSVAAAIAGMHAALYMNAEDDSAPKRAPKTPG